MLFAPQKLGDLERSGVRFGDRIGESPLEFRRDRARDGLGKGFSFNINVNQKLLNLIFCQFLRYLPLQINKKDDEFNFLENPLQFRLE